MKVLNLYCGLGGNRKLWPDYFEITNVEIDLGICKELRINFPNDKTLQVDAMEYLKDNYHKFDFIWASPPCQSHSTMVRMNNKKYDRCDFVDPSLYQIIIFLKQNFKGGFIVENVIPEYGIFFNPTIIGRHCFWSNFDINCLNYISPNFNLMDMSLNALQKYYKIKTTKNIYVGNSHCPKQVWRNMVDPVLGNLIIQRFLNKSVQLSLMEAF